jgi:hypothetical protein
MAPPWLLMGGAAGEFVPQVKRAATLPPNTRFTPDVLRSMADNEMRTRVAPALLSAGGEHLGYTWRVPVVSGRARVRLPPRTLRVRSLHLEVDGKPQPLDKTDEVRLHTGTATGRPRLWMQEGSGAVRLYPTPDSDAVLVVKVYQHPSVHVDTTAVARVTDFDVDARTLTLDAVPATYAVGAKVDVLCGQPDFQWLLCDAAVEAVDGLVVTLSSVPEDVAVDDYLTLAGETCVPQAPVPFHHVLLHAVTAGCLRGQTDGEALAMVEAALAQAEASAKAAIAPTSHQPVVVAQGHFL